MKPVPAASEAKATGAAPYASPPPDIAPYRHGNTGVEYVTTWDSGVAGPHALVNALTHGNEICGAHALAFLFERGIRPSRGRLTLSFSNVEAYQRFDPRRPYDSRYLDEDFNRIWSPEVLHGARNSRELRRARALLPIVESADFLLDLHSMHQDCAPLMLCGTQDKSLALARQLGCPQHLVRDRGHDAGRRLRDSGAFDDPAQPQTALLIECGQHWAAASVAVAIETALRFLRACGVVAPEAVAPLLTLPDVQTPRVLEVDEPVTIASPSFRFVREYAGLEVIPRRGTLIAQDGTREVRTPFDQCVLIMPARNLVPGLTAVRFGRILSG